MQDVFQRRHSIGLRQYHHHTPAAAAAAADGVQPFGLILPPGAPNTSSATPNTTTQPVTALPVSHHQILNPGMTLLKNHITIRDQVDIVKICHTLGVGPGGFQQPGYSSGSKLQLQRMCFGRNWDPETKYRERYRNDGSIPPPVPPLFIPLVQSLIQDAQAHLSSANEIPLMRPDVCLVNFYTATGRLGLHQDRDERPYSIRGGLPVVSISIGDAGEFLYGHSRDEDKLQKVVLESGDVVIFGGKSRLIFHGVRGIFPNTTPLPLLEKIKLRPGRLNLTFRQF
ncbi:putative DNA oxidative demethylase [Helianthus annuus]|nr:putative DNA oxidative demethylase [Helianthus annuus]